MKLAKCKRCGGDARIYNNGSDGKSGDWIAECRQCNNEYHGCDIKRWTIEHWNEHNA